MKVKGLGLMLFMFGFMIAMIACIIWEQFQFRHLKEVTYISCKSKGWVKQIKYQGYTTIVTPSNDTLQFQTSYSTIP